ncbi:MAG: tRNA dihydrouridine synthase DusB [Nitrospiraceae bacterium]|nr:tRNA dihydrouridine synthase DusB [Nitrospiraceae bacterium]
MIKIGCLDFPRLSLAPLAGISDLPFRMLNRSYGCRFAFTEMVSARSLTYQSRQTIRMVSTACADRPLGIQLLAEDGDVLQRALAMLSENVYEMVNLNAACPVEKVTKKGEGAALMKNPSKLASLLRVMARNSSLPVTVKIRSGWEEKSVNARDVALYAQDAGVHGVFIHGRTREQRYAGAVDYGVIRRIKEALDIPVIASGDALSPPLIKRMFDETGCDGVTIARGALGNPWIFRETETFLETGEIPSRPALQELMQVMTSHLDMCCDFYGGTAGTTLFRKFYSWYTKGLPGVKPLRETAFHASTREQMVRLIRQVEEAAASAGPGGSLSPTAPGTR